MLTFIKNLREKNLFNKQILTVKLYRVMRAAKAESTTISECGMLYVGTKGVRVRLTSREMRKTKQGRMLFMQCDHWASREFTPAPPQATSRLDHLQGKIILKSSNLLLQPILT
jgi:hypothetical protein